MTKLKITTKEEIMDTISFLIDKKTSFNGIINIDDNDWIIDFRMEEKE